MIVSPTISRRELLQATAATAGLVALGPAVFAAPPARIGFGFSLYGMRSLKVAEALKVCAEIGYSGVELTCLKDWPCDPTALTKADRAAVRSQLNDLALDLPSLMENLGLVVPETQHQTNLERLKAACNLAHDLSPDEPPLIETVLGGKPTEWESLRDKMVVTLRDWERVASSHKTVIAIKAHISGALHTPQDAKWLVQQIDSPWIRLVYDYSHFQRQKLDLKDSLATMIRETVFVHIKDNITIDGKTEFALPGDAGDIDYVEYLTLLRNAGYRGAVVVEVSAQVSGKPGYDPVAAAKHCYANIQPAYIKTGLRAET
ncbi:MAG: sugar phosphate isomerase/epimerase [Planctomycetota bacterium]